MALATPQQGSATQHFAQVQRDHEWIAKANEIKPLSDAIRQLEHISATTGWNVQGAIDELTDHVLEVLIELGEVEDNRDPTVPYKISQMVGFTAPAPEALTEIHEIAPGKLWA